MPDDGEQVTFVLPSGQKQSFLIPSGMSDNEAKLFVRSKRPDLFQTPEQQAPNALAQARAQMAARVHPSPLISPGREQAPITSPSQEEQINRALPQVNQRAKDIRSAVLAMGGAGIGSEMAGAAQGLPKFIQALAGASGAGAGAGLGALAGGASPKEALSGAAGTTATTMAFSPFAKWLTSSKSVGAKALQAASAKVGNAPVELSAQTNELVDEIVKNEKLGGQPVKAVTDLLKRLGPAPGQAAEAVPGPLSYDEARILQSNLSTELSTADLKGRAASLVPRLAKSFARDVQATATAGGAGPEHAIGMREYAQASSRNRVLMKTGKTVGIGGGIAGTLYEIARRIQRSTP